MDNTPTAPAKKLSSYVEIAKKETPKKRVINVERGNSGQSLIPSNASPVSKKSNMTIVRLPQGAPSPNQSLHSHRKQPFETAGLSQQQIKDLDRKYRKLFEEDPKHIIAHLMVDLDNAGYTSYSMHERTPLFPLDEYFHVGDYNQVNLMVWVLKFNPEGYKYKTRVEAIHFPHIECCRYYYTFEELTAFLKKSGVKKTI